MSNDIEMNCVAFLILLSALIYAGSGHSDVEYSKDGDIDGIELAIVRIKSEPFVNESAKFFLYYQPVNFNLLKTIPWCYTIFHLMNDRM